MELIRKLLRTLTLGLLFPAIAIAAERYEGTEKYEVDRSVPPFDLYEFDAWVEDLSKKGIIVECVGRDDCEYTVDMIREFQAAIGDPHIKGLSLTDAAEAAAILTVLGTDRNFPVDILVDPNAD